MRRQRGRKLLGQFVTILPTQVRLGNVDACVGDFWETEQRRALTGFASAIDSDVLRLGTVGNIVPHLPLVAPGPRSDLVIVFSVSDPINLCVFSSSLQLSLGVNNKFTPDDFLAIFDPFDRTVWALNASMVVIASFLIWLVESKIDNNSDYYSVSAHWHHEHVTCTRLEATGT